MTPKQQETVKHFEVHPSVLFRLGEDLISDEVQALAELVKNAYDADADWAVVRIFTTTSPPAFPDDVGYIEIEDNGVGMSVDVIQRGWLTVSNSLKRQMKAAGNTTKRGRTPVGDKGLGRLGAQRLGSRLTIETAPAKQSEIHRLSFDWSEFDGHEALSEIDLTVTSRSRVGKEPQGTKITVSNLYEPERLADVRRLQLALAKVISPYQGVSAFRLAVTLDGQPLDLVELETRVRDAAVIRYALSFDSEGALRMTGRMRLAHLRPNSKRERPEFHRICEADGGKGLLAYLAKQPQAKDFKVRAAKAAGWWIEFETVVHLDDVAPVLVGGVPADPGSFDGEIDVFNLSAGASENLGVFDSLADLRSHIADLHGVRIYRDGFNVRVDEDWLGLGKRWSSGSSWYGLRPATTMGYLALTADGNAQLVETTDREGFKRTPHFENFEKLLRQFVHETGEIQEFVGRGSVSYRQSLDGGDDADSPDTLVQRLSETLGRAEGFRTPLGDVRQRLEEDASTADEILGRLTDGEVDVTEDSLELMSSLNALSRHAASAVQVVSELESFISDLARQKAVGARMQVELDAMEEQLTLAYETVAVGLTAEALSHEIANIAERLARRTTDIARHVQRVAPADKKLGNFVEHVRGSVAGLRRQLAHLAPSLRYVRERRERLALSELLAEVESYFVARWRDEKLSLRVLVEQDGAILMNRGKALQVFDNLLLNSEYWLKEEVRLGRLEVGEVLIEVSGLVVAVGDNGRGIDPHVENSLFEPFVTRKPSGLGRGLGLFIIRQLLAAEGCDVDLALERNEFGRRFKFLVDMAGAGADG